MSTGLCPQCDALLPTEEVAVGRCPNCGKAIGCDGIADAIRAEGAEEIRTAREYVEPRRERSARPSVRRESGLRCPECGSPYLHSGPWPWYLGTIGAMLCRAMVCDDCGHEFDANKPKAKLATRKRNLALAINGVGLLGIVAVIGGLVLWIWWTMKR